MTDTPKLYRLYERAQQAGAMVIWSGDDKQCQAIGHGGAFSLAAKLSDAARISKNYRQENPADKRLAELMASGKSHNVLKQLVQRDDLKIAATKDKAIEQLADDWAQQGVREPEHNQIFVSTHADRKQINELCQQKRISAHKRQLRTGINNHEGQRLFQGDRIIFGENMILNNQQQSFSEYVTDKFKQVLSNNPGGEQRVRRGQFATILSLNPLNGKLRVKMDDGRLLNVPTSVRDESKRNVLGDYHTNVFGQHATRKVAISLGYASTTHSGQGSEFKNTYTLAGGKMQDRELSYVQLTRHKETAKVYTTQTEAGKELLLRSLLNKAENDKNEARANALREQIKQVEETRGERIRDSILAKNMARSRQKEFALASIYPVYQTPEIDR